MLKNYPEEEMTQSSFHSGIRLILNPDLWGKEVEILQVLCREETRVIPFHTAS
jgi:hypothetical protein